MSEKDKKNAKRYKENTKNSKEENKKVEADKKTSKQEKNKNKTKKIISIVIELILVGAMIFAGIKIYIWNKENQNSKEVLEEIAETVTIDEQKEETDTEKYNINFEELKAKNPDTVAWLKVLETNIEYPVVKAKNNDYYLTHSFDKSYNSAGWPFADYRNKFDSTDKNIIVYGHNRKDDSMFGTLKKIFTAEWYNNINNRKVLFFTPEEKSIYEIFSCYTVYDEDYYITTNFTNTNFGKFIETLKQRSERKFDVEVNENDQILTLSTCGAKNTRVVLHAKKLQIEANKISE